MRRCSHWTCIFLVGLGSLWSFSRQMTSFRGSRAFSVVKLGPTDMAFFHQTNALNSRAKYSIRSVRVNLPYSPYYLLSDGGPDFSEAAGEFNVSTFRAEGMHLSQSLNPNFTCQGHLQRIAQAARWASQHGAAYLMIWEDDTRMLKPMQTIPDVDLVTMGNVGNKHVGFWNSGIREKSMKTPAEQLAPADQRRVKQQDKFAARRGYSAGPGSIFRIEPFLKAIEATPASDLQAMYTYTEQDMCWEDFAIGNDLRIRRNPEVQQVTWAFNDGEFVGQTAEPGRNLRCLECLDACKVDCGCAERFSGKERFWSGLEQLAEFMSAGHSFHCFGWRTSLLWGRECGSCKQNCWTPCSAACMSKCPAVVHPQKRPILDCT